MSLRRSLRVTLACIVVLVLHAFAVRLAAEGEVASVLLGAGNGAVPFGAALLAAGLVVLRFVAVVVVPGALLAALAGAVAHVLVGPRRQGEDEGRGSMSGAGISVGAVLGTTSCGRGTK